MRKVGVIRSSFDPITESTIQYALKLRKDKQLDGIVFEVNEEGILSKKEREGLLKYAIKPYRKLLLKKKKEDIIIYQEDYIQKDEKEVQQGQFYKAAHGIKRKLLEEGYYIKEILYHHCKESRARHSEAVAEVCVELAKEHHVDEKKAWMMGMLHDITKNKEDSYQEAIIKKYHPEILDYSPKVWHSYTAPHFLKTELGIRDQGILKAIENHTLGRGHSKLDYILYIADKCEPTRGYDASKEIKLSKENLRKGFELVMKEAEEYRNREE